ARDVVVPVGRAEVLHAESATDRLGRDVLRVGDGVDLLEAAVEPVPQHPGRRLGRVAVPPRVRVQVPADLHVTRRPQRLGVAGQRQLLEEHAADRPVLLVRDDRPHAVQLVVHGAPALRGPLGLLHRLQDPGRGAEVARHLPPRVDVEQGGGVLAAPGTQRQSVGLQRPHPDILRGRVESPVGDTSYGRQIRTAPDGGAPMTEATSTDNTVTWWEIPVTDITAGKTFYRSVFGWDFQEFGDPGAYAGILVDGALVGGLFRAEPGTPQDPAIRLYVNVADLEATLAAVGSAG